MVGEGPLVEEFAFLMHNLYLWPSELGVVIRFLLKRNCK